MKEPNWSTCDEEELWRYVAYHLERNGVGTVLVGGAVVAIYTEGLYRSGDIDLVPDSFQRNQLKEVMTSLGFKEQGRYYKFPDCDHLLIEFPPGPVELGDESPIIPDTIEQGGQQLKILSPTSCVKDRLAGYIYWKSRDYFDQATLVCLRQPERIEWADLKKWCQNESSPEVYQELKGAVKKNS